MELIINEDNLTLEQVQEFSSKVRAILVDNNNQILLANYGKVILLPGGSIDTEETLIKAIIRELSEEIGQIYIEEELEFLGSINHFQKHYPKRDGTIQNRLVQTYYFVGPYKGILNDTQKLTSKEQKDGFNLELASLEDLESIVCKNKNDNPRNIYFQKELLSIISIYKRLKPKPSFQKIKSLKNT